MLQRTNADQVEPIYAEFIKSYNSLEDFLRSPTDIFSRLGLLARNRRFLELNSAIIDKGIPGNKMDLLKLPGVGDYIASAFLSLHCGIREVLIDSNIVRVYGRFFGFSIDNETRRKKWFREIADRITPVASHKEYNYAIIDFSAGICKPRPNHAICPIKSRCRYMIN